MVQEEVTVKESSVSTGPNPAVLQRLSDALSAFTVPDEKSLERPIKGFSKCPVREIDEYFELVAKIGRPLFKWDIIRPAFLWKLEQTMSDMMCVEAENMITDDAKKALSAEDELCEQRQFIMQKATEFDGTPFTFQRLCELLTTPSRHYKRTDKYLRALEKNINVVTTITENGERVTGVEPFPEEQSTSPARRIEQPFFVQVDECDTPIEAKMAAAADRPVRENGSLGTVPKEVTSVDSAPINLSPSRDTKEEVPDIKTENNAEQPSEVNPTAGADAGQGAKSEQMEINE